jgi:hypothetical protein
MRGRRFATLRFNIAEGFFEYVSLGVGGIAPSWEMFNDE